jgi:large subunit ribosomal protein L29
MNAQEIRALSDEKILDAIEDKKHEMWILRRDTVTGELKDSNAVRKTRREIARLKTILRERQLAAQIMSGEEVNDGK